MLATRVQQLKQRLTSMGRQAMGSLAGSVTSDVAYNSSDSDNGGGPNPRLRKGKSRQDSASENDMIVALMTERDTMAAEAEAAAAALDAAHADKRRLARQVAELKAALRDEIHEELQVRSSSPLCAISASRINIGFWLTSLFHTLLTRPPSHPAVYTDAVSPPSTI